MDEIERIRWIAFRAGVSEEDVAFVEALCDKEPDMEYPDVILDRYEGA